MDLLGHLEPQTGVPHRTQMTGLEDPARRFMSFPHVAPPHHRRLYTIMYVPDEP